MDAEALEVALCGRKAGERSSPEMREICLRQSTVKRWLGPSRVVRFSAARVYRASACSGDWSPLAPCDL